MALKIKNEKIIGTIDNLEAKLNGELPVDRLELLYLVNLWGRHEAFITYNNDMEINIKKCEAKECYDLSKVDVSRIKNMDDVFMYSLFDGDISNWNTSNVTSMDLMFYEANIFNGNISNWNVSKVTSMLGMFANTKEFNQDIGNWDVSKVTSMSSMFFEAKSFNQNISSWNLSNIINCDYMFNNSKAFLDKYNNSESLPNYTNEIKEWINNNRERMNDIDLKDKYGEEVDDFFLNLNTLIKLPRPQEQGFLTEPFL